MKKKVICLSLAAMLALGAVPVYASDEMGEDVVYQVNREANGDMNVVVDKTTPDLTFAEPLANNGIRMVVDNKELTATGVSVEGRTLVPLRALGEALGATVQWNADKQEIRIEKMLYQADGNGNVTDSNRIILMNIGSKQSLENGVANELDVAPQIIEGSTMVPARAITDFLEATIAWDEASRTVTIKSAITDSPQGARWEQQDLAIGAANSTSEYMKKVNEEVQDEKAKYRAENRPKGDMMAWGYSVNTFSVEKKVNMTDTQVWPGWGLNFTIVGSDDTEKPNLDEQEFKISVVDKSTGSTVYTTTFVYGELETIIGFERNLQVPNQYLDEEKYDYNFFVVVK